MISKESRKAIASGSELQFEGEAHEDPKIYQIKESHDRYTLFDPTTQRTALIEKMGGFIDVEFLND